MAEIKQILDDESLGELTQTIREGRSVKASVHNMRDCTAELENQSVDPSTYDTHDNVLKLGEKLVFTFESCRCGNPQHNAISCILGHVNKGAHDKARITRKKITSLISLNKWQIYLGSLYYKTIVSIGYGRESFALY